MSVHRFDEIRSACEPPRNAENRSLSEPMREASVRTVTIPGTAPMFAGKDG